jgi:hypothetical protein
LIHKSGFPILRSMKKGVPVHQSGVDKSLVAMFLRMSPEERLRANNNTLCTILEMRNACKQQKSKKCRSNLNSRSHDLYDRS